MVGWTYPRVSTLSADTSEIMEQLADVLEKLSKSGELEKAANILSKAARRSSSEAGVVDEERKKAEQDKHRRELYQR